MAASTPQTRRFSSAITAIPSSSPFVRFSFRIKPRCQGFTRIFNESSFALTNGRPCWFSFLQDPYPTILSDANMQMNTTSMCSTLVSGHGLRNEIYSCSAQARSPSLRGSCVLRASAGRVSVDTIGRYGDRHSADISTDTRPICRWSVGRVLVECQSTCCFS